MTESHPAPITPTVARLRGRAGRLGWIGILLCTLVCLSTLARIIIVASGHGWHGGAVAPLLAALATGALYDLLVALWLALPFALYLLLLPSSRAGRPFHRALRRGWLAAALFGALFVAAAEVVFFGEFDGRFNFVAVDYLIYPTEVITNIWESYPVIPVLGALAVVVALVMWAARPLLARLDASDGVTPRERLAAGVTYAAALALLTAAISPRAARISADRDLNELAANGYYTFWQALLGRDAPYMGLYATQPDSAVFPELRRLVGASGTVAGATASTPVERMAGTPGPARPLNVVVVLEESLGSELVGTLHPRQPASLTPSFDSLAAEGTLLTNVYSTGNRTIRALEATTASLPPLPGISIVRRPQSVELYTLPNLLRARGYSTTFIYGGRALFDGMGAYMRNNGMERVIEQRDYPRGTFTTAWGVADEAIFDRTLTELDSLHATGRPFYTLVLTVSNHKPYTYPAGRIAEDPAAHRREHAVRYADWALGRFMRQARTHGFFDNTLFVLMGDHGARVYGAAEIPLPSYEVPVLLYGPSLVPSGVRVGTLASSLDIAPTVMGLLGGEYESRFFGRDVLHEPPGDGRALMTHNSELALLRGGRMAVLGLRGATTVYAVDSAGGMLPVRVEDEQDRALVREAIAYFQGADQLYRGGLQRFPTAMGGLAAARPGGARTADGGTP